MKKIFLLLFITFSFLKAFVISDVKSSYHFDDFKIYHDKDGKFMLSNALKNRDKFKPISKSNIGIKKYPIWTYGKISNKTDFVQKLVFVNPRAGTDFINVHILKNGSVVKNIYLGDMNPLSNRGFQSRKSNFTLELFPNEEYEFFIRFKSFGAIDVDWNIYKNINYINMGTSKNLV